MRSLRIQILILLAITICGAGCRNVEVKPGDGALFLRVKDLREHGVELPTGSETFENVRRIAYFDGAIDIEYELELPEDAENAIYLMQTVSESRKASDASAGRAIEDTTIGVALKAYGVDRHEVAGFGKYGDASNFYILKKDGKEVGNFYTMRHGSKTYSMISIGVFFEDTDVWRELMEPKLKAISGYEL